MSLMMIRRTKMVTNIPASQGQATRLWYSPIIKFLLGISTPPLSSSSSSPPPCFLSSSPPPSCSSSSRSPILMAEDDDDVIWFHHLLPQVLPGILQVLQGILQLLASILQVLPLLPISVRLPLPSPPVSKRSRRESPVLIIFIIIISQSMSKPYTRYGPDYY